jgi:hypothetical protein
MKNFLNNLIKELISRVKFMIELRNYDKQKRNEDLWVARDENITDKGE